MDHFIILLHPLPLSLSTMVNVKDPRIVYFNPNKESLLCVACWIKKVRIRQQTNECGMTPDKKEEEMDST